VLTTAYQVRTAPESLSVLAERVLVRPAVDDDSVMQIVSAFRFAHGDGSALSTHQLDDLVLASERCVSPLLEVEALMVAGSSRGMQSRFDLAGPLFKRCLDVAATRAEARPLLGLAMNGRAWHWTEKGLALPEGSQARKRLLGIGAEMYRRTLGLPEELLLPIVHTNAHLNLIDLCLMEARPAEALEHAVAVLRIGGPDQENRTVIYAYIARATEAMGDHEKALEIGRSILSDLTELARKRPWRGHDLEDLVTEVPGLATPGRSPS
jgi:tetratricopeptide (TPR) repeat protein